MRYFNELTAEKRKEYSQRATEKQRERRDARYAARSVRYLRQATAERQPPDLCAVQQQANRRTAAQSRD